MSKKYRYYDDEAKKHVHTLDNEPLFGTTTLINEVYPPPLAWWASCKACEYLGWLHPKDNSDDARLTAIEIRWAELQKLNASEFLKELDKAYKAHDVSKRDAGKKGVDAHALIEKWIKQCISDFEGKPFATTNPDIQKFIDWATQNVDKFLWSEAHCYSEKLWVGGITDFGFIHVSGAVLIGDNKPSIYPKHFYQVAGYGIQAKENGLFNKDGERLMEIPAIDGYMIFDYKTGDTRYRKDVAWLEEKFALTVDTYKHRKLIGTPKWE